MMYSQERVHDRFTNFFQEDSADHFLCKRATRRFPMVLEQVVANVAIPTATC